MKKIMKWLEENGIQYTYTERGKNKYIDIVLEKDCIWINGFNQPMKYNKTIRVHQDTYKTYGAFETYDYSMTKTLKTSKKADAIIEALTERFNK